MFNYLAMTQGKKYDVNLIEIKFTPNVPVDEDRIADRIAKISHDIVSNETKRSWLASVSNPVSEQLKIDEENKKSMEGFIDLDKEGGIDEAE